MWKQTIVLRIDGSRAMTGDLNMGSRSITCLKEPEAYENSHAVAVAVAVELSSSSANAQTTIQTEYEEYVNNRFNHSVSSTDKKNAFQYLMDDPTSKFNDEDNMTRHMRWSRL